MKALLDDKIRQYMAEIYSIDPQQQNTAFIALLHETDAPVSWAYEVWDDLIQALKHPDNHVRAIAAQILSNLAKSDPQNRMLKDFSALLAVTRDQRFVTARHTLQSLWKVGAVGGDALTIYLDGMTQRFMECAEEKNCTLIRYDISQSLRSTYDAVKDDKIRTLALELIETETDLKYKKKYARVWKNKRQEKRNSKRPDIFKY